MSEIARLASIRESMEAQRNDLDGMIARTSLALIAIHLREVAPTARYLYVSAPTGSAPYVVPEYVSDGQTSTSLADLEATHPGLTVDLKEWCTDLARVDNATWDTYARRMTDDWRVDLSGILADHAADREHNPFSHAARL